MKVVLKYKVVGINNYTNMIINNILIMLILLIINFIDASKETRAFHVSYVR